VNDALVAAGGALPGVDTTGLNLAAVLSDGEQILVGVPGAGVLGGAAGGPAGPAGAAGAAGGVSGAGDAGEPVSLNSASLAQLESLPGVGPVLAQHILDWRTAHGRFTAIDQLRDVSGIGPVKFAALAPKVRL
jgi:competence protein ComEA